MTDTSGLEPAGIPSGGSDLSGDDSPTGNAGTAGSDSLAGDAGIAESDETSRGDALTDEDRASALEVDSGESGGINSATGIRSGTDIDSTNVAGNR
ncbi:hypothetical protein BH09ACT1_BH09ACT1_04950 [soil metagenome]